MVSAHILRVEICSNRPQEVRPCFAWSARGAFHRRAPLGQTVGMSFGPSAVTAIVFVLMWIVIMRVGWWMVRWYRDVSKNTNDGFYLGW